MSRAQWAYSYAEIDGAGAHPVDQTTSSSGTSNTASAGPTGTQLTSSDVAIFGVFADAAFDTGPGIGPGLWGGGNTGTFGVFLYGNALSSTAAISATDGFGSSVDWFAVLETLD